MREFRQPHMRGGAHAPLTAAEIEAKFMDNARYGGWDTAQARPVPRPHARPIFSSPRLDALAEFRS